MNGATWKTTFIPRALRWYVWDHVKDSTIKRVECHVIITDGQNYKKNNTQVVINCKYPFSFLSPHWFQKGETWTLGLQTVTDFYDCCVQDYPSVGQLAIQLKKNNIQPIFAVTENVKSVYEVNLPFISVPNFIYLYSTHYIVTTMDFSFDLVISGTLRDDSKIRGGSSVKGFYKRCWIDWEGLQRKLSLCYLSPFVCMCNSPLWPMHYFPHDFVLFFVYISQPSKMCTMTEVVLQSNLDPRQFAWWRESCLHP